MKNFPVVDEKTGKTHWISRSMAVSVYIFKSNPFGEIFVLTEKRGKGAADNIGKLCAPCGYVDFDETLKEAAVREVLEETGVVISPDRLNMFGICDDPNENHQNVTFRYYVYLPWSETPKDGERFNIDLENAQGGEKDEVESVSWVNVGVISNDLSGYDIFDLKKDEWAFDHDKRIKEAFSKIYIDRSYEKSISHNRYAK